MIVLVDIVYISNGIQYRAIDPIQYTYHRLCDLNDTIHPEYKVRGPASALPKIYKDIN